MAAAVNSPADVVNLALAALGHSGRVGNLYDGSAAAKKALDVYAQTRDAVLRSKDWAFAFQQTAGVAFGGTPPTGWAFGWTYPADCLRVRALQPTATYPELDPQPLLFEIAIVAGVKIILSQVSPVIINYIGQVTNMTLWDAGFVEAMAQALAAKLGPSLRQEIAPAVDPGRAIGEAIAADEPQAPNDGVTAAAAMPAQRAPGGRAQ